MNTRRNMAIVVGALWGLVGSIWLMIVLEGWIEFGEEFARALPFGLTIVLSGPAFLWFQLVLQIFESFDIGPLASAAILTIPSVLIGAGIGYGINKLMERGGF